MKPTHQTKHSAGADICASEDVTIEPWQTAIIPTGQFVPEMPEGTFLALCIRSSMALKRGLMLSNGIGVIDRDYPGEIGVMAFNTNIEPVTILKGERIGQLIPMAYVAGIFPVKDAERSGGFGSTKYNDDTQ